MPLNPKAKFGIRTARLRPSAYGNANAPTRIQERKSAQDIQDEIFRKMPANKKLKYASDFSMFLLELNRLGNTHGFSKVTQKSRRNS